MPIALPKTLFMLPSITDTAFTTLTDFFKQKGSLPEGEYADALKSFFWALEAGLKGELAPRYYLLSLDPGMGKTTAIIHFIKAWREAGFQPPSSILVGVSTLDEVRELVTSIGLEPSEFAVLTGERAEDRPGLPEAEHGRAKVMLTTQAMIRSRTRGRSFAETGDFHYQGAPRQLRIWDESILPARGVVLRLDALRALVSHVRPVRPDLVEALDDLFAVIGNAPVDQVCLIPDGFRLRPDEAASIRAEIDSQRVREQFDDLLLMAGSEMLALADDRYGKVMVGTTPMLPDDFAPVVVVDASIRVQGTYVLWEQGRGGVERLPSAGNSFHEVNIRWWNHPSGRDALNAPQSRRAIAEGIVKQMVERDPNGEWLILSRERTLPALQADIERLWPPEHRGRLHWLHWGRHRSTNQYRHIDNIVIVGLHRYRDIDYLALTLAASGQPLASAKSADISTVRVGEIQHHLLQGVCRGAVREADRGVAGQANVLIVGTLGNASDVIERTFPGANFIEWRGDGDDPPAAPPLVQRVIDYLRQRFIVEGAESITKASIAEALAVDGRNLANNAYSEPALERFLAEHGLEKHRTTFRRAASMFNPDFE